MTTSEITTHPPADGRRKRCSRCGAEFTCGPGPGQARCWCCELPSAGPVANAELDCVCPECLRAIVAGRAAAV